VKSLILKDKRQKGFYALGVLKQIESMLGGVPLCERFDLIFGTSTGAIIARSVSMTSDCVSSRHEVCDHFGPKSSLVAVGLMPSSILKNPASALSLTQGNIKANSVKYSDD
jgi:hypothetical protein